MNFKIDKISVKKGIQQKLNFVLIATVTLLLLGFGLYDILKRNYDLNQKLLQDSELITSGLSKELAFALWELDEELADEVLQFRMQSNEDISSIVIFDVDQKTRFVEKFRKDDGQFTSNASELNINEKFINSKEIIYEERTIGYIRVGLTDKNIIEQIKEFIAATLLRILIIDFLLIAILSLVIKKMLITPLKFIEHQIRNFGQGHYENFEDIKSNDEVGVISKTFSLLAKQLKETTVSRDELQEEIEQRKKLEYVLKEEKDKALFLKDAAQAAAKTKSDFLANMSHEIRTPMNSILGFTDLLCKTDLNEKQKSYLNTVASSGNLLLGIIDDILDISKLESGKITLESKAFPLEGLIMDVFNMIVNRMKNKPFDTYIDIDSNVPKIIKTDPTRLKQVLVNLLGNAVKFTSQGSIGVVVKRKEEHVLEFSVKDTGIGIPKDKLSSIFESFTQADESTTRRFGGTGLGLAITKALIEALGGKIWVKSVMDKGSDFIFTMPIEIPHQSDLEEDDTEITDNIAGKKVFIVDDNEISLKIIERCCENLKLKVIGLSKSPYEALHKLDKLIETKDLIPDVILSDIMMEGMSGFQMVKKIKTHDSFKNTVFIAITADIKTEIDYNPKDRLFNAFVTKPVTVASLINSFNSVLGNNIKDDVNGNDNLTGSCKGIKVLVVEDVLPNQILIAEYFKQLQCEAEFANNGQEAVDKLKHHCDFDLCLMDLQMPVMDGMEATEIIRADISKDLPIIALTAAVLEEDKKNAQAAGMTDFLAKPVNVYKLRDIIMKYNKLKK